VRQPISTFTALAYPLAAGTIYAVEPSTEALAFLVAMLVLGIGTFAFHSNWNTVSSSLDRASIHGVTALLAVLAVGAPGWVALATGTTAGGVLEYRLKLEPYYHAVGIFIALALIGAFVSGPLWAGGAAFSFLGAGFVFWQRGDDWSHGLWHVLTATGLSFLFLGVV